MEKSTTKKNYKKRLIYKRIFKKSYKCIDNWCVYFHVIFFYLCVCFFFLPKRNTPAISNMIPISNASESDEINQHLIGVTMVDTFSRERHKKGYICCALSGDFVHSKITSHALVCAYLQRHDRRPGCSRTDPPQCAIWPREW